jgi:hypothetical protein
VVDKMKKMLQKIKKTLVVIASLIFSIFDLSACSLNIDPDKLVPELFINTDAELDYVYSDDVYRLELLAGDVYEIDADLGEYDGEEYYIEYSLESEESILTLEENKVTVSENAIEGTVENIFIKLKKIGEDKTYQKETIEIKIVLEKS